MSTRNSYDVVVLIRRIETESDRPMFMCLHGFFCSGDGGRKVERGWKWSEKLLEMLQGHRHRSRGGDRG